MCHHKCNIKQYISTHRCLFKGYSIKGKSTSFVSLEDEGLYLGLYLVNVAGLFRDVPLQVQCITYAHTGVCSISAPLGQVKKNPSLASCLFEKEEEEALFFFLFFFQYG